MYKAEEDGSSCGEDNAKYLDELVQDMRELNSLPGACQHALRLINEEIDRVWCVLYSVAVAGATIGNGPRQPSATVTTGNDPRQPSATVLPGNGPKQPSTTVLPGNGPRQTSATVLPGNGPRQPSATVSPVLPPHSTSVKSLFDAVLLNGVQVQDPLISSSPRMINQHENILAVQRAYGTLAGSHFDPFSQGGVTVQEKIPIPYNPRCSFIGRIIGPRGISVRQIENETSCVILIRGCGSVKDAAHENRMLNHPGWEHLSEPLHVLIKATDVSQAAAEAKLLRGVIAISNLLTPYDDEHTRRQLVQLAIINGTYQEHKGKF